MVYISYANNDLTKAILVQKFLNENNILSSLVDHTKPYSNSDCAKLMLDEINKNDYFVILLSEDANRSSWVSIELTAAVKRKKKILAIKIDHYAINEEIKFSLANSQIIYEHSLKKNIFKLIEIIRG